MARMPKRARTKTPTCEVIEVGCRPAPVGRERTAEWPEAVGGTGSFRRVSGRSPFSTRGLDSPDTPLIDEVLESTSDWLSVPYYGLGPNPYTFSLYTRAEGFVPTQPTRCSQRPNGNPFTPRDIGSSRGEFSSRGRGCQCCGSDLNGSNLNGRSPAVSGREAGR